MRSVCVRFWLIFAAFGCDQDNLVARPTLSVEPPAITFGKVPTGKSRTVELRLFNASPGATLEISRIALVEGSSPTFEIVGAPNLVDGGTEATFQVTYTPDDAEPDAGEVEIISNALGATRVTVPLSSERTAPRIVVRPPSLDLGSLLSGGESAGSIEIESDGDATLALTRLSFRTLGFAGEVCSTDEDCREGRCTRSRTGPICALPCTDTCPEGYTCTVGADDGYRACREETATPPLARRGFELQDAPIDLLPGERTRVEVAYRPEPDDRGSVTLVVESNDPERPAVGIPVFGLLDNLPPVAVAALVTPLPDPIIPGSEIGIIGIDSRDPEGEDLTYRWRFINRPEGSRAVFADATAAQTTFTIDRPGMFEVALEVRDLSGLSSTNEAQLEVEAGAGDTVRVELTWDRPGTDLDLHLVRPGAPVGSSGDCFYDNQTPDWPPSGPTGDPAFTFGPTTETIEVTEHADGVYTLLVAVVAASPQGPTGATVRLFLNDVEVATFGATLPTTADAWDVATLSWPSGRIVSLETIR